MLTGATIPESINIGKISVTRKRRSEAQESWVLGGAYIYRDFAPESPDLGTCGATSLFDLLGGAAAHATIRLKL